MTHQALRRMLLLRDVSEAALQGMADAVIRRTYTPEALILLEGEPCDAAYFILEGEVRIYRTSFQGRQQILVQLGPGQTFNTAPLFQMDGRNRANAVAVGPVCVYVAPRDRFLAVVRQYPELAFVLLRDFADRLEHLTDLAADLSLRSVRGRLARFLLEQADGAHVPRRWTQDEIAAYLGTVRDMVGRSLRAFADAGLIGMGHGRIELLDRSGLEAEIET